MIVERLTLGTAVRRARGARRDLAGDRRRADARFPRAAGKVVVAPLGVSPALGAETPRRGGGRCRRRASCSRSARSSRARTCRGWSAAYGALPAELRERHPLVVVGELGWQARRRRSRRSTPSATDAIRLGYVSDAALAELYRRCAVFCYPSLGEGFGLPVLEAMAAGAAVLTSSVSSLPEVGGDAVAYCDPRDAASIVNGLESLLRAPERRAELGALALARSRDFSWALFAERTLNALERAAQDARARDRSAPYAPHIAPSRTRPSATCASIPSLDHPRLIARSGWLQPLRSGLRAEPPAHRNGRRECHRPPLRA